ncbi:MAG: hypothetical protein FWD71_05075 [Oscillospiraceae bacterium]|nr:hypothetical protein [Oscillospiraceae bacterium]
MAIKSDKKPVNKINDTDEESEYDSFPNISNTVSSSECTGMMYTPPQNDEELESYKDMFSMEIPHKKENNKDEINE